jgi:hypothetical protein
MSLILRVDDVSAGDRLMMEAQVEGLLFAIEKVC